MRQAQCFTIELVPVRWKEAYQLPCYCLQYGCCAGRKRISCHATACSMAAALEGSVSDTVEEVFYQRSLNAVHDDSATWIYSVLHNDGRPIVAATHPVTLTSQRYKPAGESPLPTLSSDFTAVQIEIETRPHTPPRCTLTAPVYVFLPPEGATTNSIATDR